MTNANALINSTSIDPTPWSDAHKDLADAIEILWRRLEEHEQKIMVILTTLIQLLPVPPEPVLSKRRIGFHTGD